MLNNQITKPRCSPQVVPDNWVISSQIWFETCRHFKLRISHHALAVAMYNAEGGKQSWETYLTRASLECQRQWDLEQVKVQAHKAHHERRGVVFLPVENGWKICIYHTYVWNYPSIKAWLTEYDASASIEAATAWFYEANAHLLPAQRHAELLASAV